MPSKKAKAKKKTLWERIKEGMATIGTMADTLTERNKPPKKPKVDTGRVSPRPLKPELSPEQEDYLRNK